MPSRNRLRIKAQLCQVADFKNYTYIFETLILIFFLRKICFFLAKKNLVFFFKKKSKLDITKGRKLFKKKNINENSSKWSTYRNKLNSLLAVMSLATLT